MEILTGLQHKSWDSFAPPQVGEWMSFVKIDH